MKKVLFTTAAVTLLAFASVAYADDSISYSKPIKLKKAQDKTVHEFEWNDVDYTVKEDGKNLIFTFNDGKYTEKHDISGFKFSKAEIGDLNGDNQPELFVYLKSDTPARQMKLLGYSSNNGKSMSMVYLPDPDTKEAAYTGYKGFDEMSMADGTFCRRFPVILENDDQLYMNGMIRQIDYKLVDGEAGRRLEIAKYYDYPIMGE